MLLSALLQCELISFVHKCLTFADILFFVLLIQNLLDSFPTTTSSSADIEQFFKVIGLCIDVAKTTVFPQNTNPPNF